MSTYHVGKYHEPWVVLDNDDTERDQRAHRQEQHLGLTVGKYFFFLMKKLNEAGETGRSLCGQSLQITKDVGFTMGDEVLRSH